MRTDELDFHLPTELIAQTPPAERAGARLLHYRRQGGEIAHRMFGELPGLLRAGDLLVLNDTKVLPARFSLWKDTGGLVEALFISEGPVGHWRVMLKNMGHGVGRFLFFDQRDLVATVISKGDGGNYRIVVNTTEPALEILARVGRMPLPPYIKREKLADAHDAEDAQRYQTVYAKNPGAVAAPTAGLHFTPEIFERLDRAGVERAFVTLHVGLGTFKPVSAETLEGHEMHTEGYEISEVAAEAINRAKSEGRRIIAVGTTSARVLESQEADRPIAAGSGSTGIFIYPPYVWRHTSALITNFHLPRSTLIALVAAMTGLEEQRRIYAEAIEKGYRFFSYGDAMFVE